MLADIEALPRYDMTIEHKCIEGWAQITHWGGARFADFMDLYAAQLPDDITHVYLETPDTRYYVSVELATMRHHQTLLAYEMLDQPLDDLHGARSGSPHRSNTASNRSSGSASSGSSPNGATISGASAATTGTPASERPAPQTLGVSPERTSRKRAGSGRTR